MRIYILEVWSCEGEVYNTYFKDERIFNQVVKTFVKVLRGIYDYEHKGHEHLFKDEGNEIFCITEKKAELY